MTSIVDISDVARPKVAATFKPSAAGCHDLQFLTAGTRDLAFCAAGGAGEVQTWDVSNPLAPAIIGRIVNPAIQFPHNPVPSPDGKLLVINDQAFAAHEGTTGTSVEGSLWTYDISDPTNPCLPVASRRRPAARLSTWPAAPRSSTSTTRCRRSAWQTISPRTPTPTRRTGTTGGSGSTT